MIMLFRLGHSSNNPRFPTISNVEGKDIVSKDEQPRKAWSPINVTPSGIMISFKDLHLVKALADI